jgi:glycosyltransferase involved in cell wall biosynthesis
MIEADLTYIICTHNTDDCILTCLESVRIHQPHAEIVVVDSNSPDKSYIPKAENTYNATVILGNDNYEMGAWKLGADKVIKPYYVFIQDSCIQERPLDPEILAEDFWALWTVPQDAENCFSKTSGRNNNGFIKKAIDKLLNNIVNDIEFDPQKWHLIAGSMMLMKRYVWEKFLETGVYKVFMPQNKFDSQVSERLLGVLAEHVGYHPASHSLPGSAWEGPPISLISKGYYFTKIWKSRQ